MRCRTETLLREADEFLNGTSSLLRRDLSDLIQRVEGHLALNPLAGRTLGPALGGLKAKLNELKSAPDIRWVNVRRGSMAIGHRPKKKSLPGFPAAGVTSLLTLLSESEGAKEIGEQCQRHGIVWHWLPFVSGDPPPSKRNKEIAETFERLKNELDTGGQIFVHCSAGIHRTGMITLAILRYLELSKLEADRLLNELRPHTAENVGSQRREWASGWGARPIG